jgi:hypothetical protein
MYQLDSLGGQEKIAANPGDASTNILIIKNLSNPSNAWLAYVYLASNFISAFLLKYSSYFQSSLFLSSCGVSKYPQQISSSPKLFQFLQISRLLMFISLAILYMISDILLKYSSYFLIFSFAYFCHHVASQNILNKYSHHQNFFKSFKYLACLPLSP